MGEIIRAVATLNTESNIIRATSNKFDKRESIYHDFNIQLFKRSRYALYDHYIPLPLPPRLRISPFTELRTIQISIRWFRYFAVG